MCLTALNFISFTITTNAIRKPRFPPLVMILKNTQKDSRFLSNFRHISLTNISYKLVASRLQHKIEKYLDSRIRVTVGMQACWLS